VTHPDEIVITNITSTDKNIKPSREIHGFHVAPTVHYEFSQPSPGISEPDRFLGESTMLVKNYDQCHHDNPERERPYNPDPPERKFNKGVYSAFEFRGNWSNIHIQHELVYHVILPEGCFCDPQIVHNYKENTGLAVIYKHENPRRQTITWQIPRKNETCNIDVIIIFFDNSNKFDSQPLYDKPNPVKDLLNEPIDYENKLLSRILEDNLE
jgi:hypothetical protein